MSENGELSLGTAGEFFLTPAIIGRTLPIPQYKSYEGLKWVTEQICALLETAVSLTTNQFSIQHSVQVAKFNHRLLIAYAEYTLGDVATLSPIPPPQTPKLPHLLAY